jgi:ABC-type branched-subunit amino acid transport system permease subunit
LLGGLGTLTGALASAAFTAVTESLTAVMKDTVHDALHPDAKQSADTQPDGNSEQPAAGNT